MILKVSLLLSFFAAVAVYFAWLHQKGAARQRESAQAERAAADQELQTWIDSVTLALRAPLGSVDDCARRMQASVKERLEAASLTPLEEIRTHVRAMERRIGDLHAFSRLSHSTMIPETIPMSALFQTVGDELRAAAPGRQMRLELRPLPSVQGDPALIRQVMHNLLDNALKFSRARKTAKIEVGCLPAHMGRNGYRTFYVKDNGVGFDMQKADKLFGIFQRLHDSFDGSGLGLAMVKQIVERHGGRVWAQSSADEGAVFFFSLPSRDK
jgi:two-component system, chemotaxis family, sensor kinase Cph1